MANRVAASGIVLVGGASRRFGSPKALARFRGETLAERAWRLLEEVCVEVLAVGKAADRLSLPFPVVDDRSELRAPIVGLVAGLRAAELPTCLVVPVDCPLLTAEALRALARALAVPQTGPLPGAYPRSLLPELEARIAAGELSLQGVSERVLELDEAILANVNTPGELLAAEVADRAAELDEVQVVLLPRSAARAGERSEACELVLVVDDLEPHLERGAWLDELGVAVRSVTAIGELGVELRLRSEIGGEARLTLLRARLARSPQAASLVRGRPALVDRVGLGSG